MSRGPSCTLDPVDTQCDDRVVQGVRHRDRLKADQMDQFLLYRPETLQKRRGEPDGVARRTIEYRGRTRNHLVPSIADEVTRHRTLTPRSSPRDETEAKVACRPRRHVAGLIKNALYLLSGIAATGWFAAYVHETQVSGPLRDANPHAPQPDHENLTGVWLHPVLYDLVQDEKLSTHFSSDADSLGKFLAEGGLSFSGSLPIMRIEIALVFEDRLLQAKFGLKYSYTARDPDQIVNLLSSLRDAHVHSRFVPDLRDVPLHRLDIANLPEPMNAEATLDLIDRKQEFGLPRPDWR